MRRRSLDFRPPWTFRMTPVRVLLLILAGIGVGTAVLRVTNGLGAVTNLSDRWPWALWTVWKLAGIALAGAGYSTVLLIYFFGKDELKRVERGAFVVSLLGYLMVCTALLLDLGQPYNAWHPLFFWGYHSVMFELFWCIGGYTLVQILEFGYIFVERVRMPRLAWVLEKIHVPVLIVGVLLPLFHQSALTSLYVIAKGRLDPLWWSLLLPLFGTISSFYIGPAVVTVENFASARIYGRRPPLPLLGEMVRIGAFVMLLYLGLKVFDLVQRGAVSGLWSGTMEGNFAAVELGLGVVVPTVMFLRPSVRRSPRLILLASWLAICGVVLNRFNIVMTGMTRSIGLGFYRPHWLEIAFVVGMASAVAVAYLFVVENFPILPQETFAEPLPVLHERRLVPLRSDRETVPERGEAGVPVGAGTSGDR